MVSFELRIILVFLVSFFAAIFVLPKLAHIAQRIGLLDQPNGRKVHVRPRPLVGGIGIVISTTFASLLFIPIYGLRGYFLGLASLLLIGFFDDFRELGHREKFLAQIAATGFLIYFSKVSLVNFGDLLGYGDMLIPGGVAVSWIITIFSVVGVTNAVNLIDGLDGLAGGLSFIAFMFFAAHASFAGNHVIMLLNLALAGAVLGFLRFNWHPSILFMGDAGSLCLGFSLSFMALALTQGAESATRPVVALLILAVPITDTLIVMSKRVMQGRSPFRPDRYHLHHIFLRYGMSRTTAVRVILGLSIVLGGVSLLAPIYGIADSWLFLIFIFYFTVYLGLSFYIIGLFRYSLKVRKRVDWMFSTDLFMRLIFDCCDVFKIFRKTKRYRVDLFFDLSGEDAETDNRGRILNISQTGCMTRIDNLEADQANCVLSTYLPSSDKSTQFEVPVEHLWTSEHENARYHGFRFEEMTEEQHLVLSEYIAHLTKSQVREVQSASV